MTEYYVDFDNGNDSADGLTPTGDATNGPWATMSKAMATASTDGDIVTFRRGMTDTLAATLNPILGGAEPNNPIILEADYDDDWSDFASSAQTYTLVHGSKTHTASATITGIAAGDWVYNTTDSDDPRKQSFEVAAVSGTTLTLVMPFKGTPGSTKTLTVMPDNPIVDFGASYTLNATFGSLQEVILRGFEFLTTRTSTTIGLIVHDGNEDAGNNQYENMIFSGGTSTRFIEKEDLMSNITLRRCRCEAGYFFYADDQTSGYIELYDCYFDGLSASNGVFFSSSNEGYHKFFCKDCEFENIDRMFNGNSDQVNFEAYFDSCFFNSVPMLATVGSPIDRRGMLVKIISTDHDGPGGYLQIENLSSYVVGTQGSPWQIESETSTVRSGGSNISLKVTPSDGLNKDVNDLIGTVCEIPILVAASSTTVTMYFASEDTADWTDNPTADEFWIEAEYIGNATTDVKRVTKSTGTVDFKTDTDFDQSLAVTFTPAEAGTAIIRVKYAKPKESSTDINIFFVDPLPVIS